MSLADIQREAEGLPADQQRALIARLVALNVRRDEQEWAEIQRRMNDRDPHSWVSLDKARELLFQSRAD